MVTIGFRRNTSESTSADYPLQRFYLDGGDDRGGHNRHFAGSSLAFLPGQLDQGAAQ